MPFEGNYCLKQLQTLRGILKSDKVKCSASDEQTLTLGEALVMLCAQTNSRRPATLLQKRDKVVGAPQFVLEVEEKMMIGWTGKAHALHCFYCHLYGIFWGLLNSEMYLVM